MSYEVIVPIRSLKDAVDLVNLPADAYYAGIYGWSRGMRSHELLFDELRVLKDIVDSHGKRLYLSFNTMVGPFEVDMAYRVLDRIMGEISPSALILNDLSLINFAVRNGWEVHVSLGSTVINSWDVLFWSDVGVKRVVISPHVSEDELREILRVNKDIEVMIYGAKCRFTYTGICRMSSYFDLVMRSSTTRFTIWEGSSKRSGICFKPCAQEWHSGSGKVQIEPVFYMCYYLAQLVDVGVRYFKIGGRGLPVKELERIIVLIKSIIKGGRSGEICTFNAR